jgi:hypothetical protein
MAYLELAGLVGVVAVGGLYLLLTCFMEVVETPWYERLFGEEENPDA